VDMDNMDQIGTTCNQTSGEFSEGNIERAAALPDAPPAAPKDRLLRNAKKEIINCLHNAVQILSTDKQWRGVLGFNELSNAVVFLKDPPTGGGHFPSYKLHRPLGDHVWVGVSAWLQEHHGLRVTDSVIYNACELAARAQTFHPVCRALNALQWDGQRRLDTWLCTLFGVADTALNRAMQRKWLIAAVARVMDPGCKADNMLILEGPKGYGKSEAFRALGQVGGNHFSDSALDLGSKDRFESIQGIWIYEFSELDGFDRHDVNRIKGFLTSRTDRYRRPFAHGPAELPRQVIFCGSTNKSEYIREDSERRFWPMLVRRRLTDADRSAFIAVISQLWAEAVAAYRAGEQWYLTHDQEAELARAQQSRVVSDTMETAVINYLLDSKQAGDLVSTEEVMEHLQISATGKDTKSQSMRIADALRKYSDGSEKKRVSVGGKRVPCYTLGTRLFEEAAADKAAAAAAAAPALEAAEKAQKAAAAAAREAEDKATLDLGPAELEAENARAHVMESKIELARELGLQLAAEQLAKIPYAALFNSKDHYRWRVLPAAYPLSRESLVEFANTPF